MEEKTVKQYSIRFPVDLYKRIEAMREERSFNAQVIWILKEYFKQHDQKKKEGK